MTKKQQSTSSSYLFFIAGAVFLITAYFGDQATYYGLGAAFIAIGGSFTSKEFRKKK